MSKKNAKKLITGLNEPKKRKVVQGYLADFERFIGEKKTASFALARVAKFMAQDMTKDTRNIPAKEGDDDAPRYLVRIYEEYEKRWTILKSRIKKFLTEKEWNNIADISFIVIIAGFNPRYANAMLYMYRQVYGQNDPKVEKMESRLIKK